MPPNNVPKTIGRYRIDFHIASGAMGHVYKAHDPVINRPVAVKVLKSQLAHHDKHGWLERFRREAHAAGHHAHPHIVTIYDFGENDDGVPYLVMEFVDGPSLDARLKQSRLTVEHATTIIIQVLSALDFAHGHGTIHRDIKPSNIMLCPPGNHVKVTDFGVAHVEASDLTIKGDLIGTPFYMAPEHMFGAPVDHRADLFSTGVVFFETISGVKPFRGKSITEIIANMQTRGPENILDHCPDSPASLTEILNRALAFDPTQRFQTAAEFSKALTTLPTGPAEPFVRKRGPIPSPVITPLAAPSPEPVLGDDILRRIETDLVRIIGPVAQIALKRTLRNTGSTNLREIAQALSQYIDNATERSSFIQRIESLVPASRVRATPLTPLTQSPSAIPPNILSKIESDLMRYIGPIATVLVRRQLTKSATVSDLVKELANHIPDDRDRNAFLKRSNPTGC